MVSAAGVTTRRRDGDGAIPGREGGDVMRRERPEGQEKREGVAGINAIRGVGGNVGGGEGGGERWCEGKRVGAEYVDFARG